MNYFSRPGIPNQALLCDPEIVIKYCASAFDVTVEEVKGTYRGRGGKSVDSKDVMTPRQLSMAIIRAKTKQEDPEGKGMPLTKIGMIYNGEVHRGKDHSTVIHSINKTSDLIEVDEDYRERVEPLLTKFGLKFIDILKLGK